MSLDAPSVSVMMPPSSVGVGTRSPSDPPVTQKSLNARLQRTWERASARIPKKIRVYRTHTAPISAATRSDASTPATMNASIERTPQYFTRNAAA